MLARNVLLRKYVAFSVTWRGSRNARKQTPPELMRTLLIATRNVHKTAEFEFLLRDEKFHIRDLGDITGLARVEEDGETFLENATIKGLKVSSACDDLVLADDSGLEVDALGGAPGVRSARFAGENATDQQNRERLIYELGLVGASVSAARFRCALVVAAWGEVLGSAEGVVEGRVITVERGVGGFGYDSLFIPQGCEKTFAELPATVKNTLSHRARAVEAIRPLLERLP